MVAVLVVAAATGHGSAPLLVGVASVALVLDAVDGQVARRTGTASAHGARFDMEVDAALLLVLSVHVAQEKGAWVLLIGLARYLLWLAARFVAALRRPTPPRYWAKVVAAVQGVALTVAAAGVLPGRVETLLLVAALALLAESFGHQVCVLTGRSPRSAWLTAVAAALLWVVLALPATPDRWGASSLVRLPVEMPVLLLLAALLPTRVRRPVLRVVGVLLGLVLVLKLLDLGFGVVLDRPFDPLGDVRYLGPAVGVLADSIGRTAAVLVAVLVGLLALALLVAVPWALVRLGRYVGARRAATVRVGVALLVAWGLGAAAGLQPGGQPFAASGAAAYTTASVERVRDGLHDRRVFAREVALDRYAGVPPAELLRPLQDKDVLLVFVESYGRVAVDDGPIGRRVRGVLAEGNRRLARAGFARRSAFLTSPTFGAASWLAHATLQAGVWVDSERRYAQLLGSDRLTLTRLFGEAGWRTVLAVPANTRPWPEGAELYRPDEQYGADDLGYRGPKLGYASMPDQYTLDVLRRRELAPPFRPRVMAEVDLVSSHHPWTPLPATVPWAQVGDGSVFGRLPTRGGSSTEVFDDPAAVRRAYADAIGYSIDTVVSFLTTWPRRDLVVVLVGDHQPHGYVSGRGAGHDVPVTILSRDRGVVARLDDWGWQPRLRPGEQAPVWRMDDFRDRFLAAFS